MPHSLLITHRAGQSSPQPLCNHILILIRHRFHGEYRTISVVQQFRRMLNGLPSVVAYDGNHYRSFRGHNDYDSLLRFATERIPLHIENLHRNQGTRFLQSGTSGKPRVLLLSAHGTAPMLFRHAAFEFHQAMSKPSVISCLLHDARLPKCA